MSTFPARPDIPSSTDFSLHWFGIPDKQVHEFWKMLESMPPGRRGPCELDLNTKVTVTSGMDAGLTGRVSQIDGGLRRVDFKHHWAKIPTFQLKEVS